jgi:hypothetical protein
VTLELAAVPWKPAPVLDIVLPPVDEPANTR